LNGALVDAGRGDARGKVPRGGELPHAVNAARREARFLAAWVRPRTGIAVRRCEQASLAIDRRFPLHSTLPEPACQLARHTPRAIAQRAAMPHERAPADSRSPGDIQ
jgi:hypothetical protein